MLQITGRGAWDCYEGVLLYACTVLVLPWTFAVALCHRADTVLDGPLVWLCMIVMFLVYLQDSCAWKREKIMLSKSIYLFVWLMSSLKQMEGKKCSWKSNQEALCKQSGTGWCLQSCYSSCPGDPKETSATCSQSTDAEGQWNYLRFFFFFLLQIMADLMFIVWKLRNTWAVAAQHWARIMTDSNSPRLIYSDETQASTQGKLPGFNALTDFSLQCDSTVTLTV